VARLDDEGVLLGLEALQVGPEPGVDEARRGQGLRARLEVREQEPGDLRGAGGEDQAGLGRDELGVVEPAQLLTERADLLVAIESAVTLHKTPLSGDVMTALYRAR
jgi:hypothetical protein